MLGLPVADLTAVIEGRSPVSPELALSMESRGLGLAPSCGHGSNPPTT